MPAKALLSALLLVTGLAAGCVSSSAPSPREIDLWLGQHGVDGVVRSEHFTLWAPGDWSAVRPWLEVVESERTAVLFALGGEAPVGRLQVMLVPVEGLGPTFESAADGSLVVRGRAGPDPTRGLHGWADDEGVCVHVAAPTWIGRPDGGRVQVAASPEPYRGTLRHELAHWRFYALGIEGGEWLDEGLAQLLEGLELEDGRLVDRGPPRVDLALARVLGARTLALEALLDWSEDGDRLVELVRRGDAQSDLGIEAAPRATCTLYLRYLLGLQGQGAPVEDLSARLLELAALPRSEHLAGETRWRAWLDEQLDRHAAAPSGG